MLTFLLLNKFNFPFFFPLIFQSEISRQFDAVSEEFALEKIIEWGMDTYAEKISDISGEATKELMIEQGLNEINAMWEQTELDIAPYEDKGHYKLKYVACGRSFSAGFKFISG